jgi:uncharacterized protein (DUF1778 family)
MSRRSKMNDSRSGWARPRSAAFAEALDEPATVNRRLASALERRRKVRWLD